MMFLKTVGVHGEIKQYSAQKYKKLNTTKYLELKTNNLRKELVRRSRSHAYLKTNKSMLELLFILNKYE